MVISHKNKFLFIHNDKCAGSAMREHFRWNKEFEIDLIGHWGKTMNAKLWEQHGHMMCSVPQHSTAKIIKGYFELMGWNWDEYFKFGIVRNPFDRMVSGYEWRRSVVKGWCEQDSDKGGNKNHFKEIASEVDGGFKQYVEKKCKEYNGQLRFFYSKGTKDCDVNFVGKFENLELAFKHIVKTILPNATDELCTLKKANASIRKKDYRSYYDEETRKIVQENCAKELEILGYEY